MTFLNPLYLLALGAAAIPIILHLLNLRKTRVIEFSTLSFLKELQRSRIRKLKIKQWLLLALRTLIIIFVVLAFTRPAMRSSLGFLPGSTANSSVVIILDDSFSMLVSDDRGQLLKQAKETARSIVDMLEPGDEAALILLSEAGQAREFTAALTAVRNDIDAATGSFIRGSLNKALTSAGILLGESNNFNKEIYILSDRQRTQYLDDNVAVISGFLEPAVRVFLFPLGTQEIDNTAVTHLALESSIFELNKPVDLSATISNSGSLQLTDALVSVFLGGERVLQKTVTVEAGSSRTLRFSVTPRSSGWIDGFVELELDDMPEDNRRYFSFSIPEHLRVLLGPSGGQDATIVRLALEAGAEYPGRENPGRENPDSHEPFEHTFEVDALSSAGLLSANLQRYDIVILLGANKLSAAFRQRFVSWLSAGGGSLLFPDADGDIASFSEDLLPALGLPAANGGNGELGGSSYSSIDNIDYDHPLFKNVFALSDDDDDPHVESPQLYFMLRLRGDIETDVVAETGSGDVFLLDARVKKGKLLVFAVSPDLRWSDLPLKGIFVPLLNRAMYYLASHDDNSVENLLGRTFEVVIPPMSAQGSPVELEDPAGEIRRLPPKSLPSGMAFTLDDLALPGVYKLKSGNDVHRAVVLNTDPAESVTARIDDDELRSRFTGMGISNLSLLDRSIDVRQTVFEVRFGVELWKYMIALALLCAMLEMIIARNVKKETTGKNND